VAVDIPDNAPEHIAIIAAWWNALPEWARPTTDDGKPPYAQLAKRASALAARGISRADVAGYIEEKYREDFWTGKPMTFKHVADKVSAWAQTHRRGANAPAKIRFQPQAHLHCHSRVPRMRRHRHAVATCTT